MPQSPVYISPHHKTIAQFGTSSSSSLACEKPRTALQRVSCCDELLVNCVFGRLDISMTFFFFSFIQKQSKDRFGLEGDEESTMLEESVSPKK